MLSSSHLQALYRHAQSRCLRTKAYRPNDDMTRLHILGVGSLGTVLAHNIRTTNPALPITLLARDPSSFPKTLSVTRGGVKAVTSEYDIASSLAASISSSVPLSPGANSKHADPGSLGSAERYGPKSLGEEAAFSSSDTIHSLLVVLKTTQTISSLRPLLPRLRPNSVITLLQNGMGTYETLCDQLFPDVQTRPYFIVGTTPHGAAPDTSPSTLPDQATTAGAPGTGGGGSSKGRVVHHTPVGQGHIKWGLKPDPRGEVDLEHWIWGQALRGSSDGAGVEPGAGAWSEPGSAAEARNLDEIAKATWWESGTSNSENHCHPASSTPHSASEATHPPLSAPNIASLTVPQSQPQLSALRDTLQILLSTPDLRPTLVSEAELEIALLLKLAVNAVINPLTAILGRGRLTNGSLARARARASEVGDGLDFGTEHRSESGVGAGTGKKMARSEGISGISSSPGAVHAFSPLFTQGSNHNGAISVGGDLVDQVVREVSEVLLAHLDRYDLDRDASSDTQESDPAPSLGSASKGGSKSRMKVTQAQKELFSYTSLRQLIEDTIHSTSNNISSMAMDVREGRETEVDFINGYIIRLGKEVGVETKVTEMLAGMVRFISQSQKGSK